ncbi:hypothetical protein JS756_10880 [Streptomyces actuosus]|uniref:Uncharacterized protein n=1 Tax=Streptomyces actuosus TaxID=1885 RepID=A0ABS2VND0_STRAS|nr:hypothetical protein [Streptomyces actuosus]
MAQPARGPATAPCPTPPVHTEDSVVSLHPVDDKPHPSRPGLLAGRPVPLPLGTADSGALPSAPAVALPAPFACGPPAVRPAAVPSPPTVMRGPMTGSGAGRLALGEICGRRTGARIRTRGPGHRRQRHPARPPFGCFPASASAFARNAGVVSRPGCAAAASPRSPSPSRAVPR